MSRAFKEAISNIASLELQESNGNIDEGGEDESECIISRRPEPWVIVKCGEGEKKRNMKTGR